MKLSRRIAFLRLRTVDDDFLEGYLQQASALREMGSKGHVEKRPRRCPMSELGHLRRFERPLITSAITLTADIRMRCNI